MWVKVANPVSNSTTAVNNIHAANLQLNNCELLPATILTVDRVNKDITETTRKSKKDTLLLSITLPNVDPFSKFPPIRLSSKHAMK